MTTPFISCSTLAALALSLVIPLAAHAKQSEPPLPPDQYEAHIATASANPKTLAAGKRAAFLCVYCHGEDGNSVQENIPNLAGQNPVYLLTQIQKFGDGRRNDEFMSGLIKELSNTDRVSMAVYFAAMRPKPAEAKDAALVEKGRKRFLATCVGCHGANAYGNKSIARLAGQRVSYLTTALGSYREGKGRRLDPTMSAIARGLSANDLQSIPAYLSTLK
jgi:cytochrome c553